MMAHIEGMERPSTLLTRLAFFLSRHSYGRVIAPARIYALDTGLLLAVGLMEEVQEGAKQTGASVKQLARMLVAWRRGGVMTQEASVLSYQQAQAFYDWMGKKQDLQAFYEEKPIRALIAHASFENAEAIFEFGCGTGALAERLLASHLPPVARYVAVDSSVTMVRLAKTRLARFGSHVQVQQTAGSLQCEATFGTADRFVSTYVADLLSPSDIAALFAFAHRLLIPGGRLCLVSLTEGTQGVSRLVTTLWTSIHRITPMLLGGCRPLKLRTLLPGTFHLESVHTVTAFGVPSEILVAERLPEAREGASR